MAQSTVRVSRLEWPTLRKILVRRSARATEALKQHVHYELSQQPKVMVNQEAGLHCLGEACHDD